MDEIAKGVFTAPLATVLVIAGVIFLLVAVVGNISGKIEPGTKGRVFSGILGLAFIIIGLAMHFTQKKLDDVAETPQKPTAKETIVLSEAPVSVLGTEKKEPEPAAVAATGEEVIEAGCGFSADQIEDEPGSTHIVACPAGCAEGGALWGTDVYTGDSSICKAAIHAGLIDPQGGSVGVILDKGRPAYRGSTRNKIESSDYGKYRNSFRLAPLKQ